MEGLENHDCATTGHCAVHGIEIERRKAVVVELKRNEEELAAIEEKIVGIYRAMASTDAFKAQVRIAVIIMGAVWFGSFVYTFNHKQEASRENDKIHSMLNASVANIGTMQGKLLVVEDRYSRLLKDLEKLNTNVSNLVNVMAAKDRVQKVNIENYKTGVPDEPDVSDRLHEAAGYRRK